MREERSKPKVAALKTWLERQLARVPAKATIAEDIRYGLNHWDGPHAFPRRRPHRARRQHRRTRNQAARANRNNALFAGHDEGAANWACVASLIATCKLNDVDPQAYFADVLMKLVNLWPASRIDALMPWAWGAAHRIAEPEKAAA